MRKAFLISGFIAAFALAVFVTSAAPPANFAGTWSLDKTKSTGLSPRMQNADSVVWTITQDGKTISIDSKVTGGQPPAGGGNGGGVAWAAVAVPVWAARRFTTLTAPKPA